MSPRRLRALFRRVVQEIRRDRPSLALLFVAPVVMTGLLTFILREADSPAVSTAIVNDAGAPGSAVASALTSALEAADISVTETDQATATQQVADGDTSVAIILPADVATGGSIVLLTNGLDPFAESSQIGEVQQAVVSAVTSAAGGRLPSVTHETVWGVPSDDPMAAFAPAIVGFFAYFFVYILTGVSFLRERTGGTLERLMATPVTRFEVVGGYSLGFGLFATIQVAILLAWTLGSIQVPSIGPLPAFSIGLGIAVNGSAALAFLVVVLAALGAVSLGIFLSTFARTELQVVQFIPIVIVPQFLLSGVLFPVSSLPAVLQPLAAIMPLTYAVNGLRQVFIRGADLSVPALQLDLLILAVIAIVFAVVASFTIRRDVA
jgi:ABC-2 type transport system permease protein